jgi:hypothetical protein
MPQYRLFSVDQHGHVVKPLEYVTCETDEEVIAKAKSMVDGLGIEICATSGLPSRSHSRTVLSSEAVS